MKRIACWCGEGSVMGVEVIPHHPGFSQQQRDDLQDLTGGKIAHLVGGEFADWRNTWQRNL